MGSFAQWVKGAAVVAAVHLVAVGPTLAAESPAANSANEWHTYGGNLASWRYRPFTQINRENFKDLEVAWRFKTDALGPQAEFNLQSTPLMVGGVLYTTAGTRRSVVALDAATGELLWVHREDEGKRGASRVVALRTGATARRAASSTSRPATG